MIVDDCRCIVFDLVIKVPCLNDDMNEAILKQSLSMYGDFIEHVEKVDRRGKLMKDDERWQEDLREHNRSYITPRTWLTVSGSTL